MVFFHSTGFPLPQDNPTNSKLIPNTPTTRENNDFLWLIKASNLCVLPTRQSSIPYSPQFPRGQEDRSQRGLHNAISARLKISPSAPGSPSIPQRYPSPCRSPHLRAALIGYQKVWGPGPNTWQVFSILPGKKHPLHTQPSSIDAATDKINTLARISLAVTHCRKRQDVPACVMHRSRGLPDYPSGCIKDLQ